MRILVLCHEHPPIGGGAAAVSASLIRQYVRRGHDVTALTMHFGELPTTESCAGADLHRVPCGRRWREMATPWQALRWARLCRPLVARLHREHPFDVAHAHFIMPAGIIARDLKNRYGVPFIVTPHGSDVPGYNRERLKLAHILARPWWLTICHEAERVVSPSRSLLQLIGNVTNDVRATVIPNGFEPGRFLPLEKDLRMLLCGRLVERKGFQYFLQAIRDLELPGWKVDIVGDGPMFDRLQVMAQNCRVPVQLHGWINNEDPQLAELHGRAMIYVFPSEWENLSIALLEGMSAGCAVIATDVAGNPEAVERAGYLVPPKDVVALRHAVLELTGDASRCADLGRMAAERAATQFNWDTLADRYLQILEGCSQLGND